MKTIVFLAIAAAAAMYAYRSFPPEGHSFAVRPESSHVQLSNPVREIQRAPNELIEMRGAMGSANAGVANAARKAVSDTIGR